MRIAFDAQLTVGSATGIGEYARGLYAALRAAGTDVVALWEPRLDPWRFDRRFLWDQVLLPARAMACRAALLHCTSGTVPILGNVPKIATVHDLAWLRVQQHARAYAQWYFGAFSLERYRACEAIVTDSAFSRGEILELLHGYDEARVAVVTPGVSEEFGAVRRASDGFTILSVGTVEPRKNLSHVVRLLPHLSRARLVSVGPSTPYLRECAALARELGVAARLQFRGYVRRQELMQLYAVAAAVVVPSTYEGFGYAAAQALCAGVPCIVSDATSLPEVAGADATVLALDDTDAWLEALGRALDGGSEMQAAAARERSIRRFSWSEAAGKICALYERANGST